MEKSLHYLIGDATKPISNPAIIAHVCNDIGGFGRGFVVSLARAFPEVKESYLRWFSYPVKPALGNVQIVNTHVEGISVANMVAQHGVRWEGKNPPIRYDALEQGLKQVYNHADQNKKIVVAPRLGAVLSGGDWNIIENIFQRVMTVETYIYTLPSQKDRWPTEYENGE